MTLRDYTEACQGCMAIAAWSGNHIKSLLIDDS